MMEELERKLTSYPVHGHTHENINFGKFTLSTHSDLPLCPFSGAAFVFTFFSLNQLGINQSVFFIEFFSPVRLILLIPILIQNSTEHSLTDPVHGNEGSVVPWDGSVKHNEENINELQLLQLHCHPQNDDEIFERRGFIEAWRVDGDEGELLLAGLVGAGVHVGADGEHILEI